MITVLRRFALSRWVSVLLFAVSIMVLITSLLWQQSEREREHLLQERKTLLTLSVLRGRLEAQMHNTLSLTRGLAAVIGSNGSITAAQFDAMARNIMAQHRHVRNITLTRGTVVVMVYPKEGNQAILGRDFRQLADQWPVIQRMFDTRQPVLAGPVPLIQGGISVIGRMPIFVTPPEGDPGSGPAWGMIAMPLNLRSLLDSAGFFDPEWNMDLAVRGSDGQGWDGAMIHGDPALFSRQPVTMEVNLPGGSWVLAGKARTSPSPSLTFAIIAPWFSLCLVIACALLLLLRVRDPHNGLDQALRQALSHAPLGLYLRSPRGEPLYENSWITARRTGPGGRLPVDRTDQQRLDAAEQQCRADHQPAQEEIVLYPGHPTAMAALFSVQAIEVDHQWWLAVQIQPLESPELTKAEVSQARRDAAEAQQARHEFMSIVSEQIRIPVHSILGVVHLLRSNPLTNQQRRWINAIYSVGERLEATVNNIADFCDLDAGQGRVEAVAFDLHALLRLVTDAIHGSATGKGVAVHCHISPDLPRYVLGDRDRLRQILSHLLGNSCKFTHQGQISLTVSCSDQTARQIGLRFLIEDTGIGLPAQALSTLFLPFRNYHSSSSLSGAGLGLAISQRLVTLLGGDLRMESEEHKGCRIWFTLSFQTAAPLDVPLLAPPRSIPQKPCSVLLVEDNPVNGKIVQHMLEFAGHSVTSVSRGHAAIEKVQQNRFDVVLLDVDMPEFDGLQTCQAIRSLGGACLSLPIIAMTSRANQAEQDRCLRAGMSDVIEKPFRGEDIFARMACWVR